MTTRTESRTTVYIVDDHELVRQAIAHLVTSAPDLQVVGEAATAAEALVGIHSTLPDVAVLDVQLPDGSGIDICRQLHASNPKIGCAMLTSHAADGARDAAILAGAAAFLTKEVRGLNLIEAIRDVAAGHSLIDPAARQEARMSGEQPGKRISGWPAPPEAQ
jgi:DNA-binding NarL/FixJ family response regulator